MKKIGCDVDGCIAGWNKAFGELLIKTSGRDLLPADWRKGPDFPTRWGWDSEAGYTKEEIACAWMRVENDPFFWESLPLLFPEHETLEAIVHLDKLASLGNDIYFITHRRGRSCKRQTERWLQGRGMRFPTVLISTGDKTDLVDGLELDAFIDDKLSTIEDLAGWGMPERLHVYLKLAPYNVEGRKEQLVGRYKVVDGVNEMLKVEGLI